MPEPAPSRVIVGRIAGVFGVKGWVRVFSYTDPPEKILAYGPWIIGVDDDGAYEVADGGAHGKGVVAHLRGVDDRDVARQLIGQPISVPRDGFAEPAPDQYYWSDLVGLQVINQDGKVLGQVKELLDYVQASLFEKALAFRESNTYDPQDYAEFQEVVKKGWAFS